MLAPCRPSGANNPNLVLISLVPHDKNQSSSDGANSNESVFEFRIRLVEDFEVVNAGKKKLTRFFEGYAVLLPIREALRIILDHLHSPKCKPTEPCEDVSTLTPGAVPTASIQDGLESPMTYDAALAA